MNNGNGAGGRKVLMAGAIGNFVEWYDFGLYALFATTISSLFFPKSDPTAALLSTFAIFGVGYFARPLGAIVFGHVGDRVGRRPALLFAVMLMSAGTVALGLLPSYAQIGTMAPVLLFVCRLVQGFSAGAESTNSGVFMVEHAPQGRRGLYASVTPAMSVLAPVVGIFVGMAVTSMTTPAQLASWGWRVPFLAAAPLALAGLYLRLRVDESPVFAAVRAEQKVESAPVVQALKLEKKTMLVLMGYAMTYAVAYGVLATFLLSYLNTTLKFSKSDSLIVTLVLNLFGLIGAVLAGYLTDVVGRKRIAVGSALGVGVCAVPALALVQHSTLLGACLIVILPAFFYGGTGTTTFLAVVELFPPRVRSSASALAYQIGLAVFGGSTPFVATWLVGRAHLPLGPGYYLAGLCAVSALVAVFGIGNRARADKNRRDPGTKRKFTASSVSEP